VEKRYQVFVSSTFQDLQDERREVIQALLELDCIPAGMELFQASNEDQWSVIKRVIDDCDYYIVIIGGRYGSIGKDSISYTEMEYRYAVEQGKPIVAFLHKDPDQISAGKSEKDAKGKVKLKTFRILCEQKMCRYWLSSPELGAMVSRSLVSLMKNSPAIGWIKGDLQSNTKSLEEIIRLRNIIDELQIQLKKYESIEAIETSQLARGEDEVHIRLNYIFFDITNLGNATMRPSKSVRFSRTWDEIFAHLAPMLVDELSESKMRDILSSYLRSNQSAQQESILAGGEEFLSISIHEDDFQTIKVQFIALKYVEKSTRGRSVRDPQTYWKLTSEGESAMMRLRAVRRTED
jgi:Domain of unknown function (DUF4062)